MSDNTVDQLGKGYAKNVGLKIFVDSNDKISAIYGTFSKKKDVSGGDRYDKPQIIALSGDNGEPVSDPIEIRKLIKDRYDYVVGEVKNKLKLFFTCRGLFITQQTSVRFVHYNSAFSTLDNV